MKNGVLVFVFLLTILQSCTVKKNDNKAIGLEMAVKMADSEIKQFPEPWTVDYNPTPIWNYTQGLIAQAMIRVWKVNGNEAYFNYAKIYADKLIDSTGFVSGFDPEAHSLDHINSGKFLFDLYENTKDERYMKAISQLYEQFKTQPRTSEGGFWHKLRYPNQMWLDGLYMAAPFYAQCALLKNDTTALNDVVNQFRVVHEHTYNPEVGLNYHGWDESKEQQWADSITGCSPNFWGRAEGWYAMALVDVLDFIPQNHPGRTEILNILNQVAAGIKKIQDPATGLWYQVLDQGDREDNYLEATASSMFSYALLKAVRKGYLGSEYKDIAVKGYNGILSQLIKNNADGTISLTKCCAVAGLGGTPYRDGTYKYYVSEKVRDNDPKGVGPFIMASLEMNNL